MNHLWLHEFCYKYRRLRTAKVIKITSYFNMSPLFNIRKSTDRWICTMTHTTRPEISRLNKQKWLVYILSLQYYIWIHKSFLISTANRIKHCLITQNSYLNKSYMWNCSLMCTNRDIVSMGLNCFMIQGAVDENNCPLTYLQWIQMPSSLLTQDYQQLDLCHGCTILSTL